MRVFDFDVTSARAEWQERGYLHLKDAVDRDFLAHLQEAVRSFREAEMLDTYGLAGAKNQFLFEFPESLDHETAIFDPVAAVTGLERSRVTLSERHVKWYNADADPMPAAHKDRLASTVALGISIDIPRGSHVVLYPDDQRTENPYLGPILRDSLEPDELPEVSLRGAREVEVHDSPGDVLMFPGASTWHLRRNSANATLLYLKFNDFDSDPLGEDPSTELRRAKALELLESGEIGKARVRLSRRFDSLHERYSRRGWSRDWVVDVWGGPAFSVSEGEAVILRMADGASTVDEIASRRPGGLDAAEVSRAVQRLTRRNAVELFS